MKIRDIFVDEYYYPEVNKANTNYLAFLKAVDKWEVEKQLPSPFLNIESLRQYVNRRIKK